MTVKELRDELSKYPDDMKVVTADWYDGEYNEPVLDVCKQDPNKLVWRGTPEGEYLLLNNF